MIDRDEIRIARRTAERNGYTVLPPREDDERDLNRFRQRQQEREDYRSSRPAPSRRFRDEVEDYDDEPVRKPVARPTRPVYREEDDYEEVPRKPARREMNDDEKLGAAIRTAEENGFTIRKMSRLDQAKQIARDNGYEVRRMERPTRPTAADYEGNDKPARPSTVRPQRTLVKPTTQPNVEDGIRTRTAPDTEIAGKQPKAPTGVDGGNDAAPEAAPAPEPKKNTYADDFMNRAAKFFGEEE